MNSLGAHMQAVNQYSNVPFPCELHLMCTALYMNGHFHFTCFSLFDAMHVTDCDLSEYLLHNSCDSSRIRSEITAERVRWPTQDSLMVWRPIEMVSNQDTIWPPLSMDLWVGDAITGHKLRVASQTQGLWLKPLVLCHWATTHTSTPPPPHFVPILACLGNLLWLILMSYDTHKRLLLILLDSCYWLSICSKHLHWKWWAGPRHSTHLRHCTRRDGTCCDSPLVQSVYCGNDAICGW